MRVASWRGRPVYRIAAGLGLVAAAIAAQVMMPALPAFSALFPAVIVSAFVSGGIVGLVGLLAATVAALYTMFSGDAGTLDIWDVAGLILFVAGGIFAIWLVELRERALGRLELERRRLDIALAAADAAVWERTPEGRLHWDANFFRLAGLEPRDTPPSAEDFLEMVHPEDRPRMAEARRLMEQGDDPAASDEYRFLRPDGQTIWLANYRARAADEAGYFIGITQDVTRRKTAEEQVRSLLQESSHRVRNQFTVIAAVARETSRHADSMEDFQESFSQRLAGLARSHDLLARGRGGGGTQLHDLLAAHLEPFGAEQRVDVTGPRLALASGAAQYIGMAFHELATNAVKHGALSASEGRVVVLWRVEQRPDGQWFVLAWEERGGPPVVEDDHAGFGSQVLMKLVPRSLGGTAKRTMPATGLVWTLDAPFNALQQEEG